MKVAAPLPVAKMAKTQIAKALAEKLATEPKQVQSFFDALTQMATEQTREAGEFTVPGLGKLVKAERKERMGRNPQTGEQIKIAAKTTVKFRIAVAVTDAISATESVVLGASKRNKSTSDNLSSIHRAY